MNAQEIGALALVGLAAGYLAWRAFKKPKDPGCGACPKAA